MLNTLAGSNCEINVAPNWKRKLAECGIQQLDVDALIQDSLSKPLYKCEKGRKNGRTLLKEALRKAKVNLKHSIRGRGQLLQDLKLKNSA